MRWTVVLLSIAVVAALELPTIAAQAPEQVYQPGPGIVMPVPVKKVFPKYTSAALDHRIQGEVIVQAVVRPDGTVADAKIAKSLDAVYGLDAKALEAARQWVFTRGTKDGVAVPVVVAISLEFRTMPAPIQTDDEFLKGVYAPGPWVAAPVVATTVEPKYTSDAIRQKIQGQVVVEAVVGADGQVIRARVKSSLDSVYGLDANAVAAAKQWTFDPSSIQR